MWPVVQMTLVLNIDLQAAVFNSLQISLAEENTMCVIVKNQLACQLHDWWEVSHSVVVHRPCKSAWLPVLATVDKTERC